MGDDVPEVIKREARADVISRERSKYAIFIRLGTKVNACNIYFFGIRNKIT